MQENTESEKPEEPENPETQEEVTSDSSEPDASYEDQEGEVLPPDKKNNSGVGIFLLLLLLLGGGGGYLFYTDQFPPQITQWVKPYYETAHQKIFGTSAQEQTKVKPKSAPDPSEKWTSQVDKPNQVSAIQKSFPVVEPKVEVSLTPPIQEHTSSEEHISGSQTQPSIEVAEVDSNYPAEISGNTTLIKPKSGTLREEPKIESITEKHVGFNQVEERLVEPAPVVMAPPILYVEEPSFKEEPPQPKERDKAVQAYLDFFESTLIKIGEVIKTGFSKGKNFLLKFLD